SSQSASNNDHVALADDEIIRLAKRIGRSGSKFAGLWDGKWQDDFPSQSEADSSLVFRLAFFTKDAAQIDRIFRRSGLMRDKWDERHGEQTYGQLTIARALETVTAQYRPRDNGASRGARRVATSTEDDERPQILIDTEEHVVVAKTIEALQSDADIFQRGGVLVRVIRDCVPGDDIRR